MPTAYIFGAGASHSYKDSPSGVRPPLASGFFDAYGRLKISEDFEVRVGDLVNYVRDRKDVPPEQFAKFKPNIEEFMTEVDELVQVHAACISQREGNAEFLAEFAHLNKVYDQTIFLFAHVLNEIQNGPPCKEYFALVNQCADSDALITFNWDTLLDRVLLESGRWHPDTGYGITFRDLLDSDWRSPDTTQSELTLLKLHGSTNWFVNYITRDFQTGERAMMRKKHKDDGFRTVSADFGFRVEEGKLVVAPEVRDITPLTARSIPVPPEPEAMPSCFVYGDKPFRCYRNRFRPGYDKLSYFFPPNDPHDDVPMMPLLIAPTRIKLYEEFKHVFDSLWSQAEEKLRATDKIVVIGYSFPETDTKILEMLRRVVLGKPQIEIIIVNPHADTLASRVSDWLQHPMKLVRAASQSFEQYLRE